MSDTKKAPIDLVPMRALVGAARVFAHGNTKKDRVAGDFIKRTLDGVFYASAMRHTMDLQELNGVVSVKSLAARDADTDLPVIDHLICNLLIMRTMLIRDGALPVDPGEGKKPEPIANQIARREMKLKEKGPVAALCSAVSPCSEDCRARFEKEGAYT